MGRPQKKSFSFLNRHSWLTTVLFLFVLYNSLVYAIRFVYYHSLGALNFSHSVIGGMACIPVAAVWAILSANHVLPLAFRENGQDEKKTEKRRQRALARQTLVMLAFCGILLLAGFGAQYDVFSIEHEMLSALTDAVSSVFDELKKPIDSDDYVPILQSEVHSESSPVSSGIVRQSLTAEQRAALFYQEADWQAVQTSLEQSGFDSVIKRMEAGRFSSLSQEIEALAQTRLLRQSALSAPDETARVTAPDDPSQTCSALTAFESCEALLDRLQAAEASYEQLFSLCSYAADLYEKQHCERAARIYADACYLMQEQLARLPAGEADSDTLLYYLAEEIAAYEELYRSTKTASTYKELYQAYSRIASYAQLSSYDRVRAKQIELSLRRAALS